MEPSNWIALCALALTGLALYLSHRERISAMRTAVYTKQLDLLKELSIPFGVLTHELPHLFIEIHDERDRAFVERARSRVDEAFVKLGEMSLSLFSILPVSLNDVFSDFKSAADDLFLYELNTPPSERDQEQIESLTDELARASLAFIHASRNTLGTTQIIRSLVRTGTIDRGQGRIVLRRELGRSPRLTLRDPEEAAREFLDETQPKK
jgi:hypothetical protein